MITVIPAALSGERVDRAVCLLTGMSRRQAAALVESGGIRLNEVPVRAGSRRVAAGESLEVGELLDPPLDHVEADAAVAFAVMYADTEVVVVDKPAGVVVHPGAGQREGTLVAGLLSRFPDIAALAEPGAAHRPGIVHRLDKGTSGLLMVARTEAARRALSAQLAAHTAGRRYRALVWGAPEAEEGLIEAPLRRATTDPTRMAVHVGGKPAQTHYRVLARFDRPARLALLDCRLETGRTHQIRVHLAAIGLAVVGDTRYGRQGRWPAGLPRLSAERLWLHAAELAFDHPTTGQRLTFSSDLPLDLAGLLSHLGSSL